MLICHKNSLNLDFINVEEESQLLLCKTCDSLLGSKLFSSNQNLEKENLFAFFLPFLETTEKVSENKFFEADSLEQAKQLEGVKKHLLQKSEEMKAGITVSHDSGQMEIE